MYLDFRPRMHPKTSLQCFALAQRESNANHCRDLPGQKNKVQYQTFSYQDAIAYPTFFITYEFSHK